MKRKRNFFGWRNLVVLYLPVLSSLSSAFEQFREAAAAAAHLMVQLWKGKSLFVSLACRHPADVTIEMPSIYVHTQPKRVVRSVDNHAQQQKFEIDQKDIKIWNDMHEFGKFHSKLKLNYIYKIWNIECENGVGMLLCRERESLLRAIVFVHGFWWNYVSLKKLSVECN